MTIPIEIEIDKSLKDGFDAYVKEVHNKLMEVGRKIVSDGLETYDKELSQTRDKHIYRNKGLRKNCIKTTLGEISYTRRVYINNIIPEKTECTYLLDEKLGLGCIGKYTQDICCLVAKMVTSTSYREAAAAISEMTGLNISHQALWGVTQGLGERREEETERHVNLMEQDRSLGALQTKILYDENDGIWLKLQGKDRKEHPRGREMKLGICYDGVIHNRVGAKGIRRTLDEKIAYGGFMDAETFRKNKAALTYSKFDSNSIELIVRNGDGAGWVQCIQEEDGKTITVLDEFHRNKKLKECVLDGELAKTLQTLLYEGKSEELLQTIKSQITILKADPSKEDTANRLRELLKYYTENKEGLIDIYKRNVKIPETRKPGEIHHARLGSMESNIFTLAGNRMKGGRECWSVSGANNLISLLCMKYTVGFEHLFDPLPEIPKVEEPHIEQDTKKESNVSSASKVKLTEGEGSEYYCRGHISDGYQNIKKIEYLFI